MTREDVIKIMSVLRGAYPQFYRDISKQEALDTINLWAEMFRDDPAELVAAAVKALIATDAKGFPPGIGVIREYMRKMSNPVATTPFEAWAIVWKAIKRSAYNSKDEFAKLPPMLQRMVGSPEQLRTWAMMDADTVQSVIGSKFQTSFEIREKQDREFQALPQSVKQMIGAVADKLALQESKENGGG